MVAMPADVTAIVPLKALRRAKGRLAPGLDAPSRRELAAWMFLRVLDACLAAPPVGRVLVVAGDQAAARLADGRPVDVVVEPAQGLATALAAADRMTAGDAATLVVAADLPLAEAADIEAVCAAGRSTRTVVVVRTCDGGTGALLRRPATVVGTAFGPASADAHVALARAADVPVTLLDVPNLALDVDNAGALAAARAHDPRLERWARHVS